MKVLLLSAYHAESHRQWAEGLQRHCGGIDWTVLSLPPRHFSWRIRGNGLSWSMLEGDTLRAGYDAILATSVTDLATLRGLCPEIALVPAAVYFHENQFAYPTNQRQHASLEPAMVNLYSALAAQKVLFNSKYNRDSMIDGCKALLSRLPDFVPTRQVLARLSAAEVLPVGIDPAGARLSRAEGRLQVLWNHRWEYDKGPDGLLAVAQVCDALGLAADFHIVGQGFRQQPPAFARLRSLLESSATLGLGSWGYMAAATDYRHLLGRCDVVLSTALHDFQGLSVMEAVAAGCVPLLPRRLCYPEFYPDGNLYYGDSDTTEAEACARALARLATEKAQGALRPPSSVGQFHWSELAPRYEAVLRGLRR